MTVGPGEACLRGCHALTVLQALGEARVQQEAMWRELLAGQVTCAQAHMIWAGFTVTEMLRIWRQSVSTSAMAMEVTMMQMEG